MKKNKEPLKKRLLERQLATTMLVEDLRRAVGSGNSSRTGDLVSCYPHRYDDCDQLAY